VKQNKKGKFTFCESFKDKKIREWQEITKRG